MTRANFSLLMKGCVIRMKKILTVIFLLVFIVTTMCPTISSAIEEPDGYDPWHNRTNRGEIVDTSDYVVTEPVDGSFCIVADGTSVPIFANTEDYEGVKLAAGNLQKDIKSVTQVEPVLSIGEVPAATKMIIIGTIGKSPIIDQMIENGKLDVTDVTGRWETFALQTVENPIDGVESALVIVGSDQRGTIFGIYDLSEQIGVSPWYFWDDVPPLQRNALYVLPGSHTKGEPAVKYRGIFINDEAPALSGWVSRTYGTSTFNRKFYEKVYEVMLRLKANYLWPAVWGKAFAEDDIKNHETATKYGIIMGTSHEAPMMRGIEEWNRNPKGTGEWRYSTNAPAIRDYWRYGIQRMVNEGFEGIVTLGMRGPGDISLPIGDGIELIEDVITDQRTIIEEVTGKDPTELPQVWTLYKEIQDYWDAGIRVPDDVTVVWCDDNWGNMRKLPDQSAPERNGGYGLYYHFDYVGGGRNYKWVDTNLIPNIWEQMNLSYEYGVDRLWVVNVGDLKNVEQPLQFFLDYAWSPESIPSEKIHEWEQNWAKKQFGSYETHDIADILNRYAKLQSDRKPELLNREISLDPREDITINPNGAVVYKDGSPFSLTNYREMENVTAEWQKLAEKAEQIGAKLPDIYQDAYYQLVLYQVKASANLYQLRLAGFKNIMYAAQKRAATNDYADVANARFNDAKAMATYYNNTLAGGKWKGFQSQSYMGYGGNYPDSAWQQPQNSSGSAIADFIWPTLQELTVPEEADMGVAIDGSEKVWPEETTDAVLPEFSPYQSQPQQYIEIFNKGTTEFSYTIDVPHSWITVTPNSGTISKEERITVSIDWSSAPKGTTEVPLTITGPNETSVIVIAIVNNPDVDKSTIKGFVESNGYVSIEADHYSRSLNTSNVWWKRILGIGRTGSGMTAFPVTIPSQTIAENTPCLEYQMYLFSTGTVDVNAYLSPRNNVLHGDGLRYAVSIDDGTPQIVNITTKLNGIPMNKSWERNTSDNINLTSTSHTVSEPGQHTLKFWLVDPTVILQKLVVDTGGLKTSYYGPPESFRIPEKLRRPGYVIR